MDPLGSWGQSWGQQAGGNRLGATWGQRRNFEAGKASGHWEAGGKAGGWGQQAGGNGNLMAGNPLWTHWEAGGEAGGNRLGATRWVQQAGGNGNLEAGKPLLSPERVRWPTR